MASFPEGRIKKGPASLVGGIAVGVCVLALWLAIEHQLGIDGVGPSILGALVAAGIAAWIRVADL
ncbi:MAG TPA: hypothetical protein VFW75_15105 [Acetobacteraceae bacterium]|nr:hypothetical protein [Acetobacteraceae bacterium]